MEKEQIFEALRFCITEPGCGGCPREPECRTTGWDEVGIPKVLALDVLNAMRDMLFQRDAALEEAAKHMTYLSSELRDLMEDLLPVAPIHEHHWEKEFYECGNCNAAVSLTDSYCSRCGKKIKWEKTDGSANDD